MLRFYLVLVLCASSCVCAVVAPHRVAFLQHADCAGKSPVQKALEQGMCGLEIDVIVKNGSLVLGCDSKTAVEDAVLKTLLARVKENESKYKTLSVYPDLRACGPKPFVLTFSMPKTNTNQAFDALTAILNAEAYKSMLFVFGENILNADKPVAVVLGGAFNSTWPSKSKAGVYGFERTVQEAVVEKAGKLELTIDPTHTRLVSSDILKLFNYKKEDIAKLRDDENAVAYLDKLLAVLGEKGVLLRLSSVPVVQQALELLCSRHVDLISSEDSTALMNWLGSHECPTTLDPSPYDSFGANLLAIALLSLVIMVIGCCYFGCLTCQDKRLRFSWPWRRREVPWAAMSLHDMEEGESQDVQDAIEEYRGLSGSSSGWSKNMRVENEREFSAD